MKDYKIEWSLSLLNKYSKIILENDLQNIDLTKTQMLFIIHLKHRPGVHQDHLAEMFKMNRSTVTRGIDQLEKLGYVERCEDVDNRKANKLILSQTGDELYVQMMQRVLNWTGILTEGMTEEEKELSIKLLTKMAGNACRYVGDNRLADIIGGH